MDAFRPNRVLSQPAWVLLLVIQGAVLLGLWILGDRFLIPGPLDVIQAWERLVTQEGLLHEVLVSLKVNVEAIALSALIAVGFSYLTVLPVMRPLVILLSNMRFFGLTGFMVVIVMMVGGGHALKVTLLTFGMSTFFITTMASVVQSIPRAEYDQARSLRMGEWRIVWEVVILGTADEAFEALRQNAAIGWMMLTVVEGLSRTEGGMGAMMLNQQKHFHLAAVFAIQGTIFVMGILQDRVLIYLKGVVCPYASLTLERK